MSAHSGGGKIMTAVSPVLGIGALGRVVRVESWIAR